MSNDDRVLMMIYTIIVLCLVAVTSIITGLQIDDAKTKITTVCTEAK